jgi:AbrB family looped-hinge helix DNA binding protein
MRINAKGQVTIPAYIREAAGLLPGMDVDFSYSGKGKVQIFPGPNRSGRPTRGEKLVAQMRRFARAHPITMTTEEIMKLMRG